MVASFKESRDPQAEITHLVDTARKETENYQIGGNRAAVEAQCNGYGFADTMAEINGTRNAVQRGIHFRLLRDRVLAGLNGSDISPDVVTVIVGEKVLKALE